MTEPSELALRVKNLPGVLSASAIRSLLMFHGAHSVRVLQHQPEPEQTAYRALAMNATRCAIATFDSNQKRHIALTKLNRLELAGRRLIAQLIDPPPAHPSLPANTTTSTSIATATVTTMRQPSMPMALPVRPPPAPIAPHLGLHYPPSPFLEYKYPRATVDIVANIANALMVLPKFYTQVLHLMNKMNLPVPFEKGAIPGVFSTPSPLHPDQHGTRRKRRKRSVGEVQKHKHQKNLIGRNEQKEEEQATLATGTVQPLPLFFVRSKSTPSTNPQPRTTPKMTAEGFQLEASTENPALMPRPGVISEAELLRQRLPDAELQRHKAMREYTRGARTNALYVKNLAKGVDESDLKWLFGCVLPQGTSTDALPIQLFREGKMKGQAFVEYPSEELAEAALDLIHGFVLEGRPVVISYRKSPGRSATPPNHDQEFNQTQNQN